MRKAMLAGACALAMIGSSSALAGEAEQPVRQGPSFVVTEGQIAQFKAVLNLTAEQEPYWTRVELVLRDIARRQRSADAADSLDTASLRRLVASAIPLFKRLAAEQKRDAIKLSRSLGITSLAFAF